MTRQIPAHTRTDYRPRASKYAVVVPVLNEGERIRAQLRRMREARLDVDIILVDGGSTDGALDSEILSANDVRVLIKTGRGLSAQMRVGIAAAVDDGYEGVVMIDGNNKDDPAAIRDFTRALDQGVDHVQGSRCVPGGRALHNPWTRKALIRFVHAPIISIASGFRYTDTTNGFRAYGRKFLTDARVQPFRDVFSKYELHYYLAIRAARCGFRVSEIPVTRSYPVGAPVPTKIAGLRGHWKIMTTLMNAATGRYNPGAE